MSMSDIEGDKEGNDTFEKKVADVKDQGGDGDGGDDVADEYTETDQDEYTDRGNDGAPVDAVSVGHIDKETQGKTENENVQVKT